MTWAVAIAGRTDRAGILFLMDDRDEADSLAAELRQHGQRVVVRLHPPVDPTPAFDGRVGSRH